MNQNYQPIDTGYTKQLPHPTTTLLHLCWLWDVLKVWHLIFARSSINCPTIRPHFLNPLKYFRINPLHKYGYVFSLVAKIHLLIDSKILFVRRLHLNLVEKPLLNHVWWSSATTKLYASWEKDLSSQNESFNTTPPFTFSNRFWKRYLTQNLCSWSDKSLKYFHQSQYTQLRYQYIVRGISHLYQGFAIVMKIYL